MICPYINQAVEIRLCVWMWIMWCVIEEHAKDTAAGYAVFAHYDLIIYVCK